PGKINRFRKEPNRTYDSATSMEPHSDLSRAGALRRRLWRSRRSWRFHPAISRCFYARRNHDRRYQLLHDPTVLLALRAHPGEYRWIGRYNYLSYSLHRSWL